MCWRIRCRAGRGLGADLTRGFAPCLRLALVSDQWFSPWHRSGRCCKRSGRRPKTKTKTCVGGRAMGCVGARGGNACGRRGPLAGESRDGARKDKPDGEGKRCAANGHDIPVLDLRRSFNRPARAFRSLLDEQLRRAPVVVSLCRAIIFSVRARVASPRRALPLGRDQNINAVQCGK
jgi:hypothetical protein